MNANYCFGSAFLAAALGLGLAGFGDGAPELAQCPVGTQPAIAGALSATDLLAAGDEGGEDGDVVQIHSITGPIGSTWIKATHIKGSSNYRDVECGGHVWIHNTENPWASSYMRKKNPQPEPFDAGL